MTGAVKLNTAGGGSVVVQPASSIASDVIVNVPSQNCTLGIQGPAFSAYLGSSQTIGTATWTKVTCQTEEFDTNSNYDNSTNYRFTPTVAGYYQFTGSVGVVTTQTGIGISFYKNGSVFKQVQNTGSALTSTTSGSSLIYCNGSTDYVEMYVYLNTGQGIQTGVTQTYFQATMTRAA